MLSSLTRLADQVGLVLQPPVKCLQDVNSALFGSLCQRVLEVGVTKKSSRPGSPGLLMVGVVTVVVVVVTVVVVVVWWWWWWWW